MGACTGTVCVYMSQLLKQDEAPSTRPGGGARKRGASEVLTIHSAGPVPTGDPHTALTFSILPEKWVTLEGGAPCWSSGNICHRASTPTLSDLGHLLSDLGEYGGR